MRYTYGSAGDITTDATGTVQPGQPVWVWPARSGTTRTIALVPLAGSLTSDGTIVSGPGGEVLLQGPDGYTGSLYASRTLAGPRYRLAGPFGEGMATEAYVDTHAGTGGTATAGPATATERGVLRLAGDLGGTADAPTVPALAGLVSGTDPRLSDARTPKGGAGGFLSGSYPSPGVSTVALDQAVAGRINDLASGSSAAVAELARDAIAGQLRAGAGISFTVDDAGDTLTIVATGGGGTGTTDPEIVRDVIGGALVGSANLQVTVNDAGDTITLTVTGLSKVATTGSYKDLRDLPTAATIGQTYVAGRSYYPQQNFGNAGSSGGAQYDLLCVPIVVRSTQRFDALTARLYSVGTAGALLRLGVYADTGTESPGQLLADGGTVDATVLTELVAPIDVTLTPGLYWIACAWQDTGTAPTTRPSPTASRGMLPGPGVWNRRSSDPGYWLPVMAGVTGALPATFSESTQWHSPPRIGLRAV